MLVIVFLCVLGLSYVHAVDNSSSGWKRDFGRYVIALPLAVSPAAQHPHAGDIQTFIALLRAIGSVLEIR